MSLSTEITHLQVFPHSFTIFPFFCNSFSDLQNLRDLDIGGLRNYFQAIPAVIFSLQGLKRLALTDLITLETLDSRLLKLKELESIVCHNCHTLQSPPSQVCAQGLHAIQKYYKDLEEQSEPPLIIPVISCAVIGSTMAGKTSLIESLKKKKRTLTYREPLSVTDDTTEVFKVNEIEIDGSKLKCFDFGGNDVYHLAYQFTIRNNYIPVIVVNMERFSEMCSLHGVVQATKLSCLNYLSHLYISCPGLGAPILVLTHRDCLSSTEFTESKEQLLTTMESLRKAMLEEEAQYSKNSSNFCKMAHFSNKAKSLFNISDIFIFSNDLNESSNIHSLTQKLEHRSKSHLQVIPNIWNEIESFFDANSEIAFILITDVKEAFPDDENLVMLRYMHDIGKVLWFERDKLLCQYVFHRMDLVTKAIAQIFHHKNTDMWQNRIAKFQPFHFQGKWVSTEKYGDLVQRFLKSGVLDEVVLHSAYFESDFPSQTAITLLKAFNLVCGPIHTSPRHTYIIPALSTDRIEETSSCSDLIPLRASFVFVGLPPPPYVFHLLTVAFISQFSGPEFKIRAASNGAVVHHGETISRIIHSNTSCELTIQVDTSVSNLESSWRLIKKTLSHILQSSQGTWVGARFICKFFCAHCLLLGIDRPDVDVDPDWVQMPNEKEVLEWATEFHGVEPVPCCNDNTNGGQLKVLKPLRFPCE